MVGAVLSILMQTVLTDSALTATTVLEKLTERTPAVSSVKLFPLCTAPPTTE